MPSVNGGSSDQGLDEMLHQLDEMFRKVCNRNYSDPACPAVKGVCRYMPRADKHETRPCYDYMVCDWIHTWSATLASIAMAFSKIHSDVYSQSKKDSIFSKIRQRMHLKWKSWMNEFYKFLINEPIFELKFENKTLKDNNDFAGKNRSILIGRISSVSLEKIKNGFGGNHCFVLSGLIDNIKIDDGEAGFGGKRSVVFSDNIENVRVNKSDYGFAGAGSVVVAGKMDLISVLSSEYGFGGKKSSVFAKQASHVIVEHSTYGFGGKQSCISGLHMKNLNILHSTYGFGGYDSRLEINNFLVLRLLDSLYGFGGYQSKISFNRLSNTQIFNSTYGFGGSLSNISIKKISHLLINGSEYGFGGDHSSISADYLYNTHISNSAYGFGGHESNISVSSAMKLIIENSAYGFGGHGSNIKISNMSTKGAFNGSELKISNAVYGIGGLKSRISAYFNHVDASNLYSVFGSPDRAFLYFKSLKVSGRYKGKPNIDNSGTVYAAVDELHIDKNADILSVFRGYSGVLFVRYLYIGDRAVSAEEFINAAGFNESDGRGLNPAIKFVYHDYENGYKLFSIDPYRRSFREDKIDFDRASNIPVFIIKGRERDIIKAVK